MSNADSLIHTVDIAGIFLAKFFIAVGIKSRSKRYWLLEYLIVVGPFLDR